MENITSVPVGYNGNQLDASTAKEQRKHGFSEVTVNIDYLILNLVGTLNNVDGYYNENLNFKPHEYGTKVFAGAHTVEWFGAEMGTLLSAPRSSMLPKGFCQFQFKNHLFYVFDLSQLKTFVHELTQLTGLAFTGINRLDIAVDCSDPHGFFSSVITGVRNKVFKIAGRTKNFQFNYESHEGDLILNGYTVGKRSSSRFLRVYNKSLEMKHKPKGYIRENWVANGIDPWDVWRFEYQLNNRFFKDLVESGHGAEQDFTWSVFDRSNLVKLLSLAQRNHFDIRFNTGKKETNKEKEFYLFDWGAVLIKINSHKKTCLRRLERKIDVSDVLIKRTIKGLLRQYYDSNQDLAFLLPVNSILLRFKTQTTKVVVVKRYNPFTRREDELKLLLTDDSLETWLESKFYYYLAEFEKQSVAPYDFDMNLYRNHLNTFL